MAYGDARSSLATETFDSAIPASFTIGAGSWSNLQWLTGGHVQKAATGGTNGSIRYDTAAPANDQYCRVTINTLSGAGANYVGAGARMATADDACYIGWAGDSSSSITYFIEESNGAGSTSLLANTGTGADRAAGDILTIECESDTIRLGSTESGGADTERLTTTDNTLAGGNTGGFVWCDSNIANATFTAWEQGDIGAAPATSILPLVARGLSGMGDMGMIR